MKRFRLIPALCAFCLASGVNLSATAVTDAYAMATAYNVFVFGTFNGTSSDVEGGLAAGGRVTLDCGYSVGSAFSNAAASAAMFSKYGSDVLVASGGLSASSGSATGYVYAAGAGASSFPASFTTAGYDRRLTSPIDFSNAASELTTYSNTLAATASNANCTISYGTLTCTATKSGVNYATVDGSKLASVTSYKFIGTAANDASLVVNVTGASATLKNAGWSLSNITGGQILLNFSQATSISMSSIGIYGTVLAPKAYVTGSNGQFNGDLIANKFCGSLEFHELNTTPGQPDTTPTPEPLTMTLAGAGLLAMIGMRRLRAKK